MGRVKKRKTKIDRTCQHCGDPNGMTIGSRLNEVGKVVFYLVCRVCLKTPEGNTPGIDF